MPCKDSSSEVIVRLDLNDRVVDFDFSKITCRKEIGGETGLKGICAGLPIEEVLELDFNDLVGKLGLEETEDQFFLYLEWEALRTAIAQYLGRAEEVDRERYQIASITCEDFIEIRQIIRPLQNMPKLIPCRKRVASSANPPDKV